MSDNRPTSVELVLIILKGERIIDSCTTTQHLDVASNWVENALSKYGVNCIEVWSELELRILNHNLP